MVLDRADRRVRLVIGPNRVNCALAADGDAVIAAITLVRAIGGVVGWFQQRHVHVLARDVLHRRVVGFAQCDGVLRVPDKLPGDRDNDAMRVALKRDGMVWSWKFDGLVFGFGLP